MGLKIWLPLNGDLRNQGASGISAINTNAVINTAGKIGSCYYMQDTTSTIYTDLFTPETNNFSFCCWYKAETSTSGYILGLSRAKEPSFMLFKDGATNFRLYLNSYSTYTHNLDITEWHHYAITYDSNKTILYIDGQSQLEREQTVDFTTNEYRLFLAARSNSTNTIGNISNHCGPCYYNDIRYYNHCLSAAEVREISQGLVLHYKLDSFQGGYGNPNLITRYDTSFLSYPDGAVTLFTNQMNSGAQEIVSNIPNAEKCLHLHSNGGANRQFRTIPAISGKSYTISVDYYSTSNQATPLHCELNGGNYSWTVADGQTYNTPGQWTRLSTTYTSLTSNATLYYFIWCSNGTDCYVKNFKIEEGISATNWTPDSTVITAVEDSSGYNHNGTITGNLSLSDSTPRYQSSIYFEDYTRYISCLLNNNWIPDTITMSCWIKGTNRSARGGYHIPLNMHSTNYEISITSSSGLARMGYVIGGTRYVSDIGSNILDGNWHMLTSTFNGSTICRYIDGTLINSENRSGALTAVQTLGIGAFPGGTTYGNTQLYESDVRIYATALDADAIRQLYEVGAKVDNRGNLHTFEINEFGANQLTKTGTMKDYMVEPYKTLSDGSHWQLMMFHYVDEGRNMFTSTNASYCNDFGLYSRLRDIDKFKYTDTLYEFYVIQDDLEYRWTQTNAPTTSSSPGTVTTVSGYNNPSVGLAKNGSNTYLGYNSWWGACGCWTVWQGNAIPGFGGRNCTKYLALYARISNSKFKLATQNAYAENFIEL